MNTQRQLSLIEQQQRISTHAQRMIWVTFQREGIHRYPAAATDPKLATGDEYDVSFLASPHRHIFHFRVSIAVLHDDRDIEFIQFKRWLLSMYSPSGSLGSELSNRTVSHNQDGTELAPASRLELNNRSCEMIAEELYHKIAQRYPDRDIEIEVSEDNENGCRIRYNTTMPHQSVRI